MDLSAFRQPKDSYGVVLDMPGGRGGVELQPAFTGARDLYVSTLKRFAGGATFAAEPPARREVHERVRPVQLHRARARVALTRIRENPTTGQPADPFATVIFDDRGVGVLCYVVHSERQAGDLCSALIFRGALRAHIRILPVIDRRPSTPLVLPAEPAIRTGGQAIERMLADPHGVAGLHDLIDEADHAGLVRLAATA